MTATTTNNNRVSGRTLVSVAAYIERLGNEASKPTVKQHLAVIRQLFDYLTTGGILEVNPAASVRGSKYPVRRGRRR